MNVVDVIMSFKSGLNPRQNFKLNEKGADCYYCTVKEMTTGNIIFNDKTDKITKSAVEIINKRSNLEKGDILFSGIGTIGKVALVDIETDNWNCSESVYLLKPNTQKVMPKYLLYYFRSSNFQNLLNKTSIGSTLKGVRKEVLLNIKIVVPPLTRQKEIVEILDKFNTLVNDISKGLPREIELRRKQYEYYRERLVSFG